MHLFAQITATEHPSALARLVEPWSALYGDSKVISSAVLFFHLVPLLVAGGAALVADRATLRVVRGSADDRARQLVDLRNTHPIVIGGLALSLTTGLLLFLSDVDAFLGAVAFWVKLTLIALLLANGFVMTRTEHSLASGGDAIALWNRMRTISILSVMLWLATTLAGVVLTNYA